MFNARQWLEDGRKARQFEDVLKQYDIFGGDLEEMTGGFYQSVIDGVVMADTDRSEIDVVRAFMDTDNLAAAAAKMGCSTVWFNVLLNRVCAKIDAMLEVSKKYCPYRFDE